jgi:hypothetical protein
MGLEMNKESEILENTDAFSGPGNAHDPHVATAFTEPGNAHDPNVATALTAPGNAHDPNVVTAFNEDPALSPYSRLR